MNERNSGNGGGRGIDDDGSFDADEEPTVVLVSRDFLIGSLGRTASALHGAGDVCLDARALVTTGASDAAIADLIEELEDLSGIIAGMARALKRIEFKEG